MAPIITIIQQGDTSKPQPFTIAIIANPALETPWQAGVFAVDPIMATHALFQAATQYVVDCLFGLLPNEAEQWFADPGIGPMVKIVSVWAPGLAPSDATALVAQDSVSSLLVARRDRFMPFLATFQLEADVAYAISGSATHSRASAWYTTDDDGRPGVTFTLDGVTFAHRHWYLVPGTIAMHHSATALTALHEFQHAASSYSNGQVVDLYVDSPAAPNCKRGRPIPVQFARYNGSVHASDLNRDGLGYPTSWQSYHCELHDTGRPAVMDNYWQGGPPEACQNDTITRQFLRDRLSAKIAR